MVHPQVIVELGTPAAVMVRNGSWVPYTNVRKQIFHSGMTLCSIIPCAMYTCRPNTAQDSDNHYH